MPHKEHSKFSTAENEQTISSHSLLKSIPRDWREWLSQNLARGCDRQRLKERGLAEGFSLEAIDAVFSAGSNLDAVALEESSPTSTPISNSDSYVDWLSWFQVSLTESKNQPRAWRLDTPLAQVYEIPNFLNREECQEVIRVLDGGLKPSIVTHGDSSYYRTSHSCDLKHQDPDLAARMDHRLAALLGVDPSYSDPLEGQRYDPGQYFKQHMDAFAPGTKEFHEHTTPGGQRTWTVMIYLNAVELGGETCFKRLGRCYTPVPGLALAWNNLHADGTPNPFTMHEGMPVELGQKWILTKWFRALPGRNG